MTHQSVILLHFCCITALVSPTQNSYLHISLLSIRSCLFSFLILRCMPIVLYFQTTIYRFVFVLYCLYCSNRSRPALWYGVIDWLIDWAICSTENSKLSITTQKHYVCFKIQMNQHRPSAPWDLLRLASPPNPLTEFRSWREKRKGKSVREGHGVDWGNWAIGWRRDRRPTAHRLFITDRY